MARPRVNGRAELPENLYTQVRSGREYFIYRSPLSKTSKALGFDKEKAVSYASEANLQVSAMRRARTHAVHAVKHGSVDRRGLLDASTIGRKALLYESVCGVYFLLQDEDIVYVGQSINVLTRLAEHFRASLKQFNRVFVIECKAAELNHLEAMYIDKFRPKFNEVIPYVHAESTAWDASLADILMGASEEKF